MALDTLSDVLRGVRLRGAVFFNVSGSGDWAAEAPPAREIAPLLMPGAEHVIEYHAVAQGSCWAAIPGGPSVRLERGDAPGAYERRRRRAARLPALSRVAPKPRA